MNIDKQKQRILVVDDSRTYRLYLRNMLSNEGYEFIEASDGINALDMISGKVPDLILLDFFMPGMNGIEVAKRLKENSETSSIPIIMVTSGEERILRKKALETGVDDFLRKTGDRIELIARVRSLLKLQAAQELEIQLSKRTLELQNAFEKIEEVSLDTIYRLSRAAVYRDEGTGAHIKRVSHFAAVIARVMGLGKNIVDKLLFAAPMHDIGKIGISDNILLKTDKLDQNEWEIMKNHTVIGSKILANSPIDYIQLGETIALTHHEKFDGSGYPQGLKGSEIPLSGRITALADVFDALGSKRPYKNAIQNEALLEIIKKGRETHFDPDVTDSFFSVIDEILSIKEQFKDEYEQSMGDINKADIFNTLINNQNNRCV